MGEKIGVAESNGDIFKLARKILAREINLAEVRVNLVFGKEWIKCSANNPNNRTNRSREDISFLLHILRKFKKTSAGTFHLELVTIYLSCTSRWLPNMHKSHACISPIKICYSTALVCKAGCFIYSNPILEYSYKICYSLAFLRVLLSFIYTILWQYFSDKVKN